MKKPLYLVAGLGQTGIAAAGYLHRKNLPFVVFDTRKQLERLTEFSLKFPDVEIFLGEFPASLYPQLTQIIASPGLSLELPFFVQAARHHIPIIGDLECLAQEASAPVIAITGTNGKSTVTTLVGEMAKEAKFNTAVAGNIGLPILDLLPASKAAYDLWVLELSSFQLELANRFSPFASTILNITPDHLDRHHTIEAYQAAKQHIYHGAQHAVFNRHDKLTYPTHAVPDTISFGLDAPPGERDWGIITKEGQSFLACGNAALIPTQALKLYGKHNWMNALAACALASVANIPQSAMMRVLEHFGGLAHRCQTVRTLHGVDWINDSKGTNVGATLSAIEGMGPTLRGKIILIAGGIGKGADFSPLQQPVKTYVKEVVLIGEDAPLLKQALNQVVPLADASTLADAIKRAKQVAAPGDVVLLSPACASMDMFDNYIHRGQCFIDAVNQLQ